MCRLIGSHLHHRSKAPSSKNCSRGGDELGCGGRVEQGEGKKDRYTILSQRLLCELKKYKQTYQPGSWVFFGKSKMNPCTSAPPPRCGYPVRGVCRRDDRGLKQSRA